MALGSGEKKGFFGRLWGRVKKNAGALIGACLTGNFVAVTAVITKIFYEAATGLSGFFLGNGPGGVLDLEAIEPSNSEQIILEDWNDNKLIPFLDMLEPLLAGDIHDKNKAIVLMKIYADMLNEQVKQNQPASGLSVKILEARLVYVMSIFSDIQATFSPAPNAVNTISTVDYKNDLDILFLPGEKSLVPNQTDVNLFPGRLFNVNIDLNIPHEEEEREQEIENLTNPEPMSGSVGVVSEAVITKPGITKSPIRATSIADTITVKPTDQKETNQNPTPEKTEKKSGTGNFFVQILASVGAGLILNELIKKKK